jgi:hypothetical protein
MNKKAPYMAETFCRSLVREMEKCPAEKGKHEAEYVWPFRGQGVSRKGNRNRKAASSYTHKPSPNTGYHAEIPYMLLTPSPA